jgi:acetyl-CoA carboxylase carboxyltransferase component
MVKIANFVRFCDSFNIPIVNFIDTPGFLPDFEQEIGGLSRYMSRLIHVYSQATTPVISVVVRKAYGAGFVAMACKLTGADLVYAYPNAEFAVTDVDTDASMLGIDKEKYKETVKAQALDEFVDDVIEPKWTRSRLINALRLLETKRRKLPPKKFDVIP